MQAPMDAEVAAETVAGAAGDQTERRRGIDQAGRHFVHRAVPAHRHDEFAALRERLLCQRGGVAPMLRQHDVGPTSRGKLADTCNRRGGAAGAGIDDEAGFQDRG